MLTSDCALALHLIAEAVDLAATAGMARFVAPVVNEQTGDAVLAILDREPEGDHVRVAPDGSCATVFVPVEATSEP